MNKYTTYYEILNIPIESEIDVIKEAFRILSFEYHPDKNNNSIESNIKYIKIINAYNQLKDIKKKKIYDNYINIYKTNKNKYNSENNLLPGKKGETYKTNEEIVSNLNYILWDIEDYLIRNKYENDREEIKIVINVLDFIDKWVLQPNGYIDYFYKARKIENNDKLNISIGNKYSHNQYVDVNDYFYVIRKRMDKLLNNIKNGDLFNKIGSTEIRIIDGIIEAENYAIYNLSILLKKKENVLGEILEYQYSNILFKNITGNK